ncbi:hypothetical protein G173_gp111 [Erwinia phage phiEaH2]|uniref:Uncharacterized protein n=1 Tax=Erwinia phage phiEaH2 TaxID=1029988 RepID=J7KCA7_9CAUD|nr:hypothetical protein G173_gp111 [Erwinia phage phiEaH2]AFQ96656.1 hypothetical protein [Erwinia phage phiEaH2]
MYTRRDWGRKLASAVFWLCAALVGFFYLLFCAVVIIIHLVPYLLKGLEMIWDWLWSQRGACEWRGK